MSNVLEVHEMFGVSIQYICECDIIPKNWNPKVNTKVEETLLITCYCVVENLAGPIPLINCNTNFCYISRYKFYSTHCVRKVLGNLEKFQLNHQKLVFSEIIYREQTWAPKQVFREQTWAPKTVCIQNKPLAP